MSKLEPRRLSRKSMGERCIKIPDIVGHMKIMFNDETIAKCRSIMKMNNIKNRKTIFETFKSIFLNAAGGAKWSI